MIISNYSFSIRLRKVEGVIMKKKIVFLKTLFTGFCTILADQFGVIGPAMILFIILMAIDYISGMLAAKTEALTHPRNKRYGWSSKKGLIGIYKKIGYILTILVALSTDYVIFNLLEKIGIQYNTGTLFGLLTLIWFIINELISILENIGRMGVKLPPFIINVLSEIKDDIEKDS